MLNQGIAETNNPTDNNQPPINLQTVTPIVEEETKTDEGTADGTVAGESGGIGGDTQKTGANTLGASDDIPTAVIAENGAPNNNVATPNTLPSNPRGFAWVKQKAVGFAQGFIYFIRHPFASFSKLGNDTYTSAQDDLRNLRDDLNNTWQYDSNKYKSTALHLAAIAGKLGYTPLVTIISLTVAGVKCAVGASFMLLGGDWFTLVKRTFNTCKEIIMQGARLLKDLCVKIFGKAWEFICRQAKKLWNFASKVLGAFKDSMIWIGKKIASAARFIGRVLNNLGLNIYKAMKNIGYAAVQVAVSAKELAWGAATFTGIMLLGLVKAAEILDVETGLLSLLTGVVKAFAVVEEEFAAGVGAFMDHVYASGVALSNAAKGLFGYRAAQPAAHVIEEQPVYNALEEEEEKIPDAQVDNSAQSDANVPVAEVDTHYYYNLNRRRVQTLNNYIASAGNYLAENYRYYTGANNQQDAADNDDANRVELRSIQSSTSSSYY